MYKEQIRRAFFLFFHAIYIYYFILCDHTCLFFKVKNNACSNPEVKVQIRIYIRPYV